MNESREPLTTGLSPRGREIHERGLAMLQAACSQRLERRLAELTADNADRLWRDIHGTLNQYRDRDLAAQDLERARQRYREATGREAPETTLR